MSDFNRMVHNYTVRESNTIKRICEPLHRQFLVRHFWFGKTTEDGRYFSLASNPEMHDYYHSLKFHRFSPFFHKPDFIQQGFYFYNSIEDSQFQQSFDDCSNRLHMSFGGSLVIKKNDAMYRFGYAFDKKIGSGASQIIINNFAVLQAFNAYFLKEANKLIQRAESDAVSLPDEMGQLYYAPPNGLKTHLEPYDKLHFLSEIGSVDLALFKKLSKKELDILKLVHDGLTARLIALEMRLSQRTIEKHLESIKNKLNCFSKAEVHQKARLFHIAGFY